MRPFRAAQACMHVRVSRAYYFTCGASHVPINHCAFQALLRRTRFTEYKSCAACSTAAQLQARSRQATGSALKRSMSAGEDGWMVIVMLLFALYRNFPVSSVMVMPARSAAQFAGTRRTDCAARPWSLALVKRLAGQGWCAATQEFHTANRYQVCSKQAEERALGVMVYVFRK